MRLKDSRTCKLLSLVLLAASISLSGCSYYTSFASYYNIYYNVKRRFAEAEKDFATRQAGTQQGRTGSQGSGAQPRASGQGAVDKYRKVIESGSKLLEYYPSSRWIDDTLLLMGISYFRMADYVRAERKFNELLTIYPNGEHSTDARLWIARVLSEDKREDEAISKLSESLTDIHRPADRAAAEKILGDLYFKKENWQSAADHYVVAVEKGRGGETAGAQFRLGVCYFKLSDFGRARDAFRDASVRLVARAEQFECELYVSRSQMALGEYAEAERTLQRLLKSGQFSTYESSIELEIAALLLRTDRLEDGTAKYLHFLETSEDRNARQRAYYELGLAHRDIRSDLHGAKVYLDSAIALSADRAITDSARAAADQISRGLSSLDKVIVLEDSLHRLEELYETAPEPVEVEVQDSMESAPMDTSVVDEAVPPISDIQSDSAQTVAGDTVGLQATDAGTTSPSDSLLSEVVSPEKDAAAIAADSLLRALELADSMARVADMESNDSSQSRSPDTAAVSLPTPEPVNRPLDKREVKEKINATKWALQATYLRAAEFYTYTLADPDSALAYYAKSAASESNATAYWKANLQLARRALADSSDSLRTALEYYTAVIEADSVPVEAQNEARRALGMSEVQSNSERQAALLQQAEEASLNPEYSTEYVQNLYDQVILLDTLSSFALRAMRAQFLLYDGTFGSPRNPDSAVAAAEQLVAHFPTDELAVLLTARLAPDDSSSIFYRTDEELQKKYMPVATADVLEETPDESGWPPPEESLRGRRYH